MQLSAPIREPSESHNATEQYILQQTQEIGRLESGRACCVRKDAQSIVVAFSAVSWTFFARRTRFLSFLISSGTACTWPMYGCTNLFSYSSS